MGTLKLLDPLEKGVTSPCDNYEVSFIVLVSNRIEGLFESAQASGSEYDLWTSHSYATG